MNEVTMDFENPFSDYGSIVHGERFIGRHDSLRVVENRVIRPKEPGNLAIVGDYRIGKSSLAYQAIIESRDELIARRQLPIWVNLGTYDQAASFFRSLVTRSYDELDELQLLTDSIIHAAKRALEDELSWTEGYGRIQRYFERIRQAGIRILFILDEFDHARHLFKGDISGFQGLRELSYRPEWRINFVTISRRSLRDIELQTKSISTFDLIFYNHYLGMFDETDMQEYFARLSSVGIEVTLELKERVYYYCGRHPFLLEMLGYELVEQFREFGVVDVDQSARRIEQSLMDHYQHVVSILSEDSSLKKLLQILFGPVIDVNQTDIEEFQRYGIIKPSIEKGTYTAFSSHFQTYLRLIERQVDLWPLWRETEVALRSTITSRMIEQYGEQWIENRIRAKPNLKLIFEKCQEAQQKEQKAFGSRASQNLLDFTYPQDLFAIIFAEWSLFSPIFGKDRNYWDQRAQLLSKIRNPLAHNRDRALYDHERQIGKGYCEEILEKLRVHE